MDTSAFKQQLLLTKDRLQSKIILISEVIQRLDALHGVEEEVVVPAKIGRRGRPRSTKSKVPLLREHDIRRNDPAVRVDNVGGGSISLTEKELKATKKKQYMDKWLAKKRLQKVSPGFNGSGKADNSQKPNKFSLEREFELDDKDISLMRSYLTSWKGTGRLEPSEIRILDNYSPRAMASLATSERNDIRNVFYGCRARVMQKTIKHSKEA